MKISEILERSPLRPGIPAEKMSVSLLPQGEEGPEYSEFSFKHCVPLHTQPSPHGGGGTGAYSAARDARLPGAERSWGRSGRRC